MKTMGFWRRTTTAALDIRHNNTSKRDRNSSVSVWPTLFWPQSSSKSRCLVFSFTRETTTFPPKRKTPLAQHWPLAASAAAQHQRVSTHFLSPTPRSKPNASTRARVGSRWWPPGRTVTACVGGTDRPRHCTMRRSSVCAKNERSSGNG